MATTFTRDPRPRVQYSGDGSRIAFPFPFRVQNADDLLVWRDAETATGFAINGLGDPLGGEILFAAPPAAGTTITILRRTESSRETAFVDGAPFRAAAVNAELDRIMLLIQEDRDEHARALRARPAEGELDFCLPEPAARANRLLGFDSAGRPMAFGLAEVPGSGDAGGALVQPAGATAARALAEHLAAVVNVRDFGAVSDGVTNDAPAFQAALTAAAAAGKPVHVPASSTPYLIGASLELDGMTLFGAGSGTTLKLGLASGAGIELQGVGARLAALRVLGPAANVWPGEASEVVLDGVALDGVRIAAEADDATVEGVEIAACHTGLAIGGRGAAIMNCGIAFCRNGVELRASSRRYVSMSDLRLAGCSRGIRADGAAGFEQLGVRGGQIRVCGKGVELNGPASGRRTVALADLRFAGNLEVDLEAGPRHSVGLTGSAFDAAGKRAGTGIDLRALGTTDHAPNLIAESNAVLTTQVVPVQLSGGTNLDLLQPGDLIVLASDPDDLDDAWTALKATRAGVVQRVISQSPAAADIRVATATAKPLPETGEVVRVVGRFGTASIDSVGSSAAFGLFTWLRAADHCRVRAAHNSVAASAIKLSGPNAVLHHLPGLGSAPASFGGVELGGGRINGAFARLLTFEIAQDAAVSFVPDSTIGMVHAFGHGSLGDITGAVFTYRADALGYTTLLVGAANVQVAQLTALTGTTGTADRFTYSAHTDGKIYIENRLVGPPRKVSLYVIGAPLSA